MRYKGFTVDRSKGFKIIDPTGDLVDLTASGFAEMDTLIFDENNEVQVKSVIDKMKSEGYMIVENYSE